MAGRPDATPRSRNRREFLQATGAAAGAAFAAPYIITSKALGDATTPPASDRIVMGGIGNGNMGRGDQSAFLRRPDVQYVAVCDVRKRARDEGQERTDAAYGTKDCAAYVDFRELLARDDVDAVHIATPDHWHSVMTIAACRAGKDVYLQKPETLTLREGPLMVAAARRYGRVVSGGSQRVLDDYRGIVDPIWAGEIGNVTTIDVQAGPPSMACHLPEAAVPPDIDWDLWLGPAPWEPYNPGRCDGNFGTNGNSWRSYVDYSGGSLTDWGAHNFGGLLFAADLREQQPEKVTYHPASADNAEPAYVSLTYPRRAADRPPIELFCNRPQRLRPVPSLSHERGIHIVGDGSPRAPQPVPRYRHGESTIYGDFIECVKTRQRPFRELELGVNTMTAPHLVGIALRLERSLVWDREAQRFTNDEGANRLLDRARREPWSIS